MTPRRKLRTNTDGAKLLGTGWLRQTTRYLCLLPGQHHRQCHHLVLGRVFRKRRTAGNRPGECAYSCLYRTLSHTILTETKICSGSGSPVFSGTDLADCSFMAPQIQACQKNGKIVTLSLGGADSKPGFSSDSQAQVFADQIWNSFLGGSGAPRPFGNAVLDG